MNKFLNSIIIILFFLTGCAFSSKPQKSKTYQTTILSPILKINDVGFLHEYKNSINLQIYSSGINSANIKIGEKICINTACFNKKDFNEKFFLNSHYNDIFSDILRGAPIYDGINLKQTSCGYEQNIRKDIIEYKICNNKIEFNDRQNRIKIILKELK